MVKLQIVPFSLIFNLKFCKMCLGSFSFVPKFKFKIHFVNQNLQKTPGKIFLKLFFHQFKLNLSTKNPRRTHKNDGGDCSLMNLRSVCLCSYHGSERLINSCQNNCGKHSLDESERNVENKQALSNGLYARENCLISL